MRMYNLSMTGLIERFFLIMAIIVVTGFAGHFLGGAFWFLGLLAFPVLMSCLLGLTFPNKHVSVRKPEFRHHVSALTHHHKTAHH